MLQVDDQAGNGVRQARAGLEAARAGDDARAASAFERAEADLAGAAEIVDAWWVSPARLVPVLAQHINVVDEVAGEGRALAALSADQVATLDISGLSDPSGGFELDRIADLQPRAATVAAALDRALEAVEDASTPWLVPPAADRLDQFATEVASAAPAARNAADALALAPELLGADRPRSYVVLVGNPAESRELGGFVGGLGVLRATDGDLEFETVGTITEANRLVEASGLQLDGDLPPRSRPATPGPSCRTGRTRSSSRWSRTSPRSWALQSEPNRWTASSTSTRTPSPPSSRSPAPYRSRAKPKTWLPKTPSTSSSATSTPSPCSKTTGSARALLRDAAEEAIDRLVSGEIPDPRRMADVLAPAVRARRLLFSTTDATAHPLLDRIGLRVPLDTGAPDQILVAQQNLRANKLDAYLQRDLTYEATVDGDGQVTSTLTVDLTNSAPDGLDPYVTGDGGFVRTVDPLPETLNRISLDVYSALEVTGVFVDGRPAPSGTSPVGRFDRTSVPVDVAAGTTVSVQLVFAGVVERGDYDVALVPNGAASVDTVAVGLDLDGRSVQLERRPLDRVLRVGAPDLPN